MYANGEGFAKDYVQAHMWFNLAASRATAEDQKKFAVSRDEIASRMTGQQ